MILLQLIAHLRKWKFKRGSIHMSKQMISKGSEINFPASKILSSNVLFVPTILLTVSQRSKSDPFNLSRFQH